MKKLIVLASGALFLLSCQKEEKSANLKENVSNVQFIAYNPDLWVTKDAVKYNRDMVMLNNGKYDCSKSGSNCNVTKRPEDKKIAQLALLDSYIASNNTSGYFANGNPSLIFPDLTDLGKDAIISGEIFLYKKDTGDADRLYVLSSASSENNIDASNTVAIWSFVQQ